MISNFIAQRKAQLNLSIGKLQINYTQQQLIIDPLHPNIYQNVTHLVLNHCSMRSLQGIEQFINLQNFSFKYNQISELTELNRISNKQKLVAIHFVGNDIQYYGGALFINLIKHFPNLIELNGKNYLYLMQKNKKKGNCLKQLVIKSHQIKKDMKKTMKKQQLRNQLRETKRLTSNQLPEAFAKKNSRQQRKQIKNSLIDSNNECDQQEQHTSRKQKTTSFYDEQDDLSQHKQQKQYSYGVLVERDLSLGCISNIPITKSIQTTINGDISKYQKNLNKKGLQIVTLNQSLQKNNLGGTQPTATFAMQRKRQKQNIKPDGVCNFVFRNKDKLQKYQKQTQLIEQLQSSCIRIDDCVTNRSGYSYIDHTQFEESYSDENSFMKQERKTNDINKAIYAQVYYHKELLYKIFKAWNFCKGQRNLPMRRKSIICNNQKIPSFNFF